MENNITFNVGDIVILKKNHACGENLWQITRVGVDIKLKCQKCNHEVMIDRMAFYKRFKKKVGESNA